MHEQGEQYLYHADEEAESGADDLYEPELFGEYLVEHGFQSVGAEVGDLIHHDLFQVQIVLQMGYIVLHNDGEELLQFRHKDGLELIDRFVANEHGDHGHGLFQFVPEKIVDVLFHEGKHFLDIDRVGDGLFDVLVGEKLLAYDATQAFGYLLLAFGEDAVEGKAKEFFGLAGMEKELQGHPDGEPVDKCRDEGDGIKPPGHILDVLGLKKKPLVNLRGALGG